MPAVRYDSPTWGGFRFETSWGTNTLTPSGTTPDSNFWDIAAFYTADWNSIKLSAAAAYTWQENGNLTGAKSTSGKLAVASCTSRQVLVVYAMGQWESPEGANVSTFGIEFDLLNSITISNPPPNLNIDLSFTGLNGPAFVQSNPDTDVWYIKPFWRKTWTPAGATTLFGEYGQYNDQFAAGTNLCSFTTFGGPTSAISVHRLPSLSLGGAALTASSVPGDILEGAFVTGSEVQRWGLGVVQEIDSAAMHVFARWQHQEMNADIIGLQITNPLDPGCLGGLSGAGTGAGCNVSSTKIHQCFDDWDLFQVGGIIFF